MTIETGLLWVRVSLRTLYVPARDPSLTARSPPPVVALYVRPAPIAIYVTEQ